MAAINLKKVVYEGWTIGDFINELQPLLDIIMSGLSWKKPLTNKDELKKWCVDNQPYYKKPVTEVVNYFAQKYNLK